jgi:ferredoxin-thioredoxin reductase catalytic subunit
MNARGLYEKLKPLQEKQGYHFNEDMETTMPLLEGLLENKERYGYMVCPCRLASGDKELDKDIMCPCAYRAPDVQEYGSCYCALYVSDAWNSGECKHEDVPERRPVEKTMASLGIPK